MQEARGRADGLDALRRAFDLVFWRLEQIRREELRFLHPEDKRRVLMASRTRVEIDREGRVRITGMVDLDVTRLLPTDGAYRTDPAGPEPPEYAGVVERGITPP